MRGSGGTNPRIHSAPGLMAIKPKRTAVVARELAPAGLRSGPKADNSKQQLKAWLDDAKKAT
jgi:hypothetical protein